MIQGTGPARNKTESVDRLGPKSPRGRAAVIGSGFGGLAAAIRLQAMGFETVCYESRDKADGLMCTAIRASLLMQGRR